MTCLRWVHGFHFFHKQPADDDPTTIEAWGGDDQAYDATGRPRDEIENDEEGGRQNNGSNDDGSPWITVLWSLVELGMNKTLNSNQRTTLNSFNPQICMMDNFCFIFWNDGPWSFVYWMYIIRGHPLFVQSIIILLPHTHDRLSLGNGSGINFVFTSAFVITQEQFNEWEWWQWLPSLRMCAPTCSVLPLFLSPPKSTLSSI